MLSACHLGARDAFPRCGIFAKALGGLLGCHTWALALTKGVVQVELESSHHGGVLGLYSGATVGESEAHGSVVLKGRLAAYLGKLLRCGLHKGALPRFAHRPHARRYRQTKAFLKHGLSLLVEVKKEDVDLKLHVERWRQHVDVKCFFQVGFYDRDRTAQGGSPSPTEALGKLFGAGI